MARLPIVIADPYHMNTSLKLPIEKEPGGIILKRPKQKSFYPYILSIYYELGD
ncbi:MAG: hypothetical protein KKI06_14665 [Euryarchaeota archaeon]|nr:hypothetical protein [Euryarchaeota archaeon]